MPEGATSQGDARILPSARRVLLVCSKSCTMSQRAHFWLRIVGLTLILAAEFGPRLVPALTGNGSAPAQTSMASAADGH